jgi:hypothetical protein
MKARKKLTLTLAGAVAALALASIGFAAIPDSGGVIHGCYKKDTGALRVYDDTTNSPKQCTDKEAPLNWNQHGGVTDAYINYSTNLAVVSDSSWPGTVVSSRSVPEGSYMFVANLVLKGYLNSYPSGTTACQLVAHDNATNYDYWANGRGTYPADGFTPLGLSVVRTFGAGGGTIAVRCVSPVQAQVESVYITALSVGQIHY